MRIALHKILTLIGVCSLLSLVACDVHEFPEEAGNRIPYFLHLEFDTDMPLFGEVPYTRNDVSKIPSSHHDVRYIIKAYRDEHLRSGNRIIDTTFIFTKSDIGNLNHTVPLYLYEGDYTLYVWTDYVDVGEQKDKYYDASDFQEIILKNKDEHVGSNDYRDAFRGAVSVTVADPKQYAGDDAAKIENQDTAFMVRPMGKFEFIATDLELFLTRVVEEILTKQGEFNEFQSDLSDPDSRASYEQIVKSIDLNDFTVVFNYSPFMPCSYNMFKDMSADSWENTRFKSKMMAINESEMSLGFDYVFVGEKTTPSIYVEVYNKDGQLMSRSNPVSVPVYRSKLTIVKGEFLTSQASGGVSVEPGFEDEYNHEIK